MPRNETIASCFISACLGFDVGVVVFHLLGGCL